MPTDTRKWQPCGYGLFGWGIRTVWLLVLALTVWAEGGLGSDTVKVEPKAEGGAVWNAIPLDCTGRGGPINILQATYGLPLGVANGCTKTPVPIGNLNKVAGGECDGKDKCVVSSCPCNAGNTCPPGAACDPSWADPAKGCPKGMTITYRCGASSWGLAFLALMMLSISSYVLVGVAYARRVQGRKSTGSGIQAMLQLHPHFGRWIGVLGLVEDGMAYTKGRRTMRTPSVEQQAERKQKTQQDHRIDRISRSSDEEKQSKERKEKKERSRRPLKTAPKESLLETAAPASANGSGSKATASAGGGRWVHVPE